MTAEYCSDRSNAPTRLQKPEVHTKAFCIPSPYGMGGRLQPHCAGEACYNSQAT